LRFSFVVPHYDKSISDEVFLEGMESISKSTYKDFEVLIYHDGPVSRPLPDIDHLDLNYKFKQTKKRYNDWGHTLRDAGIKEAKGEYIIHFNPDNLLDPNVLEEMSKINHDIIICPIIMEGVCRVGNELFRTRNTEDRVILDGFPVARHNIDAMQLVMRRSMWLLYKGWYDKSEQSDGNMYQRFVSDNPGATKWCGNIIGVHR